MSSVNIVMYHYVRDLQHSRYPEIKGLDVALFRRQLDFLRANFTIIRMEDLLLALDGGSLPENAALLTFDDGYIDHYTVVFPLLDALGLQGSFFPPGRVLEENALLEVNKIHFTLASSESTKLYQALLAEMRFYRGTEFAIPDEDALIQRYAVPTRFDSGEIVFIKRMLQTVLPERLRVIITDKLFHQFVGVDETAFSRELYCDAEQFRTMKRHGMHIGLHGYNHGWLGNMEQDEYERDIAKALDYMGSAGLIDRNAWVMNYPYGSWSNGVVDFIQAQGCAAGLTTKVAVANLRMDAPLLLPRLDTNDYPPKSETYKSIT